MLNKHSQIWIFLIYINDIAITIFSWILSYYVRFYSGLFLVNENIPSFGYYVYVIPVLAVIWPTVFNVLNLYLPKRNISL